MNLARWALDHSERALTGFCVIAFAVMFLLGIAAVLFRFVLEASLAFPEELIRYLFVWAIFLGSAVALRRNAHAAIGIFVGWLPPGPRRGALLLSTALSCVFFGILLVYGYLLTVRVVPQISPALEISMAWAYGAVPAGGFFMLIYAAELFVQQLVMPASELTAEGA